MLETTVERPRLNLHDLLEALDVSVWFSERDIILGQPFMREIDKGLAKTRIGLVLITPAFLKRIEAVVCPRRNSPNFWLVTC